jgi:hypothetical protein
MVVSGGLGFFLVERSGSRTSEESSSCKNDEERLSEVNFYPIINRFSVAGYEGNRYPLP